MINKHKTQESKYVIKVKRRNGKVIDENNIESGWCDGAITIERDRQVVFDSNSSDEPIEDFLAREFGMRKVIIHETFSEEWV